MNVETALLRKDQHIPVIIAEGLLFHRSVRQVHVDGETFMECRVAVSSEGLQSLNEIDFLSAGWKVERMPGELCRADMNSRV